LVAGMRGGEILAIKKCDVDFNTRLLLLEEQRTDIRDSSPLTRPAPAMLQERSQRAEGKLFPITANALRLAGHLRRARRKLSNVIRIGWGADSEREQWISRIQTTSRF
jgi:integrase